MASKSSIVSADKHTKREKSLIDEYFEIQTDKTKIFGVKTIVFMEVGSFFEAYATNDKGYDLLEISKLINVIRTKKNTKDPEVNTKNPYMLGFPKSSVTERLKILTDNGITVVLVRQVTMPPQKVIRKISGIYTPGTNILSYSSDVNYVISIYIKEEKQLTTKSTISLGISACDITTGKVFVYESYSSIEDENYALDESLRFICTYNPKEIILSVNSQKMSIDFIKSYLDINDVPMKVFETVNPLYFKLSYQQEMIKCIYPNHGILSPIEYIGMEKLPYSIISFVMLLEHINLINPVVLKRINIPKIFCQQPTLHLGNNAVSQLSIFNNNQVDTYNKRFKCLFDIVDNTSTPFGRRYLKNILNSPHVDGDELQNIYDIVELLTENKLYQKFGDVLKTMGDIEKIYRKMILGVAGVEELYVFIQSMIAVKRIINFIQEDDNLDNLMNLSKSISELPNIITHFGKLFNIDNLKSSNENAILSYYNKHVHNDIDKLYDELNEKINFIGNLQDKLIEISGNKAKTITTKKTDRDGYYYCTTKIRAIQLQEKLKTLSEIKIGMTTIKTSEIIFKQNPVGNTKIIIPEIDSNSDDIASIRNNLNKLLKQHFIDDINNITSTFGQCIRNTINTIAKFDYYVSNAKTSVLYKYTRPIIDEREYGYIDCIQLRHPIIERLIDYEYIAHDIVLGKSKMKGMLLYGLNSSGKSSMMKALGISIIMAQAGMFVPAKKFVFSPYSSIFTRISGGDNIFKELSSFSVEMVELKAIWKRSDAKTLVIGDEVCRGTEQISGNAIVAATLIKLSQQNASFIFATHLHEIVKLPQIKAVPTIKAFHLSVSYDEVNDRLVFDRLLKEGSGEEIYGITVAKYIIQDNEFTTITNEIKNELIGAKSEIIQPKVSKYNSAVYIDHCAVCNKKLYEKDDIVNLDTHHINQQKDCKNGVVKHKEFMKKNDKSNLIVLCKTCHNNVHDGKLIIDKYVSSTSGKVIITK